MKKYILKNSIKSQEALKGFFLHGKPVQMVNNLSDQVDLRNVLDHIEQRTPRAMLSNVDSIYIGEFEEFFNTNSNFNALYKDGAIYVSNHQDNDRDMIDDIVHEIAHSLEKENYDHVYGDDALEKEFLAKRKYLYHLLPEEDRINMLYFLNPEYDLKFDNYLYKKVGYKTLRALTNELFYSPYGITALKEYWANGFENYILGDRNRLKDLSPVLHAKVKTLFNDKREEDHETTI